MNKQILAVGCGFFFAFASGAYAHDERDHRSVDPRAPAGSHQNRDADVIDRHQAGKHKAEERSTTDRIRPSRERSGQNSDEVERSDEGDTATESGLSGQGGGTATGSSTGGSVVHPDEP